MDQPPHPDAVSNAVNQIQQTSGWFWGGIGGAVMVASGAVWKFILSRVKREEARADKLGEKLDEFGTHSMKAMDTLISIEKKREVSERRTRRALRGMTLEIKKLRYGKAATGKHESIGDETI